MRAFVWVALATTACIADLDGFMHNPRHCDVVGPATCEDKEEPMDRLCAACDTPYDFAARGMPEDRVTTLSFTSGGVTNDAYFVAAARDSALKNITIVLAHGNYGGIEHYLHAAEPLYTVGANLFIYEYPGYGKSSDSSTPTEQAFFANADDAYALLLTTLAAQTPPLQASDVVFYGMSLGALPTVHLAKQHVAKAMILESPYPSASLFLADSTGTAVPASYVLSGSYDNLDKLPGVTHPTLLMHSEGDDFIRIEHSDRLWEVMNEPKCFWRTQNAEHGISSGIPVTEGYAVYAEVVRNWLTSQSCPQ